MGGASVHIAESVAATEEGICELLERCTDGVIGFDAEFTVNQEHKLVALIQLAVTSAPLPRCAPISISQLSATHKITQATTAGAATSQPAPTQPLHAAGLGVQDSNNACSLSKTLPAAYQTTTDSWAPPVLDGRRQLASRKAPFVLLVRMSKMGFRMPALLLRLLQDPGLVFVTVNFKAGDGPSLQRTLQMHCTGAELRIMDAPVQRQFDLDTMTNMGVARWGAALFGAPWSKPKPDDGRDWLVSVSV